MEGFIILVLVTTSLFGAISMQEYYLDVNGTSFIPYQQQSLSQSSSLGVELNIPIYQYDEVLHHYRSDIRKREPQFLGFDIQDDNIEIDMEIAVPFLSVPTKKSIKRKHFANINVAAMILAAVVAVGGTILGGTARFLRGENFFNGQPWLRNGNKKKKSGKQKRDIHELNKSGHEDFMWNILSNIDESLLEIDFDIYDCAQRFVCWQVKNSLLNVHERRANNVDKFIVGIIKTQFANRMVSNTIWNDAIEAGRKDENCEKSYARCMPENVEHFASKIQKYAKMKK